MSEKRTGHRANKHQMAGNGPQSYEDTKHSWVNGVLDLLQQSIRFLNGPASISAKSKTSHRARLCRRRPGDRADGDLKTAGKSTR